MANPLDDAGPEGCHLADSMYENIIADIRMTPFRDPKKNIAIARLIALRLEEWADDEEMGE